MISESVFQKLPHIFPFALSSHKLKKMFLMLCLTQTNFSFWSLYNLHVLDEEVGKAVESTADVVVLVCGAMVIDEVSVLWLVDVCSIVVVSKAVMKFI